MMQTFSHLRTQGTDSARELHPLLHVACFKYVVTPHHSAYTATANTCDTRDCVSSIIIVCIKPIDENVVADRSRVLALSAR